MIAFTFCVWVTKGCTLRGLCRSWDQNKTQVVERTLLQDRLQKTAFVGTCGRQMMCPQGLQWGQPDPKHRGRPPPIHCRPAADSTKEVLRRPAKLLHHTCSSPANTKVLMTFQWQYFVCNLKSCSQKKDLFFHCDHVSLDYLPYVPDRFKDPARWAQHVRTMWCHQGVGHGTAVHASQCVMWVHKSELAFIRCLLSTISCLT